MMLAFIYTKNVNNQKVSFYFALKNKDKVPQRPSCAKEWTAFSKLITLAMTHAIGHINNLKEKSLCHQFYQMMMIP